MVRPFQTEAFDGRQSGDDHKGLIGGAGPVVSIELKACGARTRKQTPRPREAELLARPRIVTAAGGGTCRCYI